ncbi:MAG: hypothetical protein ABI682_00145 [Acidobacteriota bacterium]
MSRALPWSGITSKFKTLARPAAPVAAEESRLYYRRACLAAAEERFDVALIFCAKALELEPLDLATRLLVGKIHDRGLADVSAAVTAYRKVIALASYDPHDPYCSAAQAALDQLVQAQSD